MLTDLRSQCLLPPVHLKGTMKWIIGIYIFSTFKLSLEEVDYLFKAVYEMFDLQEEKVFLALCYLIYQVSKKIKGYFLFTTQLWTL